MRGQLKGLEKEFSLLAANALQSFQAERWPGTIRYARSVDVRYRGQGYELNIPYTSRLVETFHAEHARRYGYSHPDRDVEFVTIRLRASIGSPQPGLNLLKATTPRATNRSEQAAVAFDGRKTTGHGLRCQQLTIGKKYSGPAIVTEYSATTAIPPGLIFWADSAANLIVQIT